MPKKLLITMMVIMITGIVFLPEITVIAARQALRKENQKKSWAPAIAYRSGVINMRMWRYKTGRDLLQRAIITYPQEEWSDEAMFQIGLCYEKSGEPHHAIASYLLFAQKYPHHEWVNQALKRVENIKANQ